MSWRWTALALSVLSVGTIIGVLVMLPASTPAQAPTPTQTPAQTPPQPPAQPPAPTPEQAAAGYVGAETCKACHPDQHDMFASTKMGRLFLKHPRNAREALGCENCHGPGKEHVEKGGGKGVGGLITFAKNDKTPIDKRNEVCLACHTKGARLFWKGSAHEARDVACTNCHRVMSDQSPKALLAKVSEIETCGTCHIQKKAAAIGRSSHMPVREGKMTCTSCHNPHGTTTPALLREIGENETCYRCHAEKRGPFLWIHSPVPESCSNCHDPHGSNHEQMLKIAKPRLCQQCHVLGPHGAFPDGRGIVNTLRFEMGRACVNCHANIHGSNHPAGKFFTR
jgi:DmsE family decaheme c-type cytochrome